MRTSAGGMAAVSRGRANSLIAIDDPSRASSDARLRARLHARSLEVTSPTSSSPPHQARPLTMQRGPARSGSACNAFACNARALHAMLRMQCSGSACNAFGAETGSSRRRPGRRHRSGRALASWGCSSVSSVWVCAAWVAPKGQGSDAHGTVLPYEASSRLAGALATALATEFVRCMGCPTGAPSRAPWTQRTP